MTCSRRHEVQRYHDDELSAEGRAAMESHLATCAECRALREDLVRLSAMLQGAPRAALPPEALARIRDRLQRARERSVVRVAGWLTAAAAAVLIVAVVRGPSERSDTLAYQPAIWQTVAATPPADVRDDGADDWTVMAQWMTDELTPNGQR